MPPGIPPVLPPKLRTPASKEIRPYWVVGWNTYTYRAYIGVHSLFSLMNTRGGARVAYGSVYAQGFCHPATQRECNLCLGCKLRPGGTRVERMRPWSGTT